MTFKVNEENFDDVFNYALFMKSVDAKYKQNPDWRYGQAYFNTLVEVNPFIAERIRTSKLDPFFRDQVSQKTHEYVLTYWSKR